MSTEAAKALTPDVIATDFPVGGRYFSSDRILRQAVEEADITARGLLARVDISQMGQFLTSLRQVAKIYTPRGVIDYLQSTPSSHENIVYALNSTTGTSMSLEAGWQNLQTLAHLETAYYGVAARKADLKARQFPDNPDLEEVSFQTQSAVARVIWQHWKPRPASLDSQVDQLRGKVIAHINFSLDHVNHGRAPREYGLRETHEGQNLRPIIFEDSRQPPLERWYGLVSGIPLQAIFTAISELDINLQLGVLGKFGFIDSSGNRNIPLWFAQAVEALEAKGSSAFKAKEEVLASGLVDNVQSYGKLMDLLVGESRANSSRWRLVGQAFVGSVGLASQLSDQELRLLAAATTLVADSGTLRILGIDEIAHGQGISESSALRILAQCCQAQDASSARYIGIDGEVIASGSTQIQLIRLAQQGLAHREFAGLSPLQMNLLQIITTPSNEGRYVTLKAASEKTGIKKVGTVLESMVARLSNTGAIDDLHYRLTQAVSMTINDQEAVLAKHVLSQIESGKPIISNQGSTVKWQRVARDAGVGKQAGKSLPAKLKKIPLM